MWSPSLCVWGSLTDGPRDSGWGCLAGPAWRRGSDRRRRGPERREELCRMKAGRGRGDREEVLTVDGGTRDRIP